MSEYISREELKRTLKPFVIKKGVMENINAIPSANVRENVHGKWILKENNSAVCSKCNRNNKFYGRYCKFCGSENLPEDVPFYFGL